MFEWQVELLRESAELRIYDRSDVLLATLQREPGDGCCFQDESADATGTGSLVRCYAADGRHLGSMSVSSFPWHSTYAFGPMSPMKFATITVGSSVRVDLPVSSTDSERAMVRLFVASTVLAEAMGTREGWDICTRQLLTDVEALCPEDLSAIGWRAVLAGEWLRANAHARWVSIWMHLTPAKYADNLRRLIRGEVLVSKNGKMSKHNEVRDDYERAVAAS